VIPSAEGFRKKPYDQIPVNERAGFGFVLGGYSAGSFMGETWLVFVPLQNEPVPLRKQGDYSINWFGSIEPIDRYLKGYSQGLIDELRGYVEKQRGNAFTENEQQELNAILVKAEFPMPLVAMPIAVGVECVRFLVQLGIDHFRFTLGAEFVAGGPNIGKATYMDKRFEILEEGADDDLRK
jgi:hypothetical protein